MTEIRKYSKEWFVSHGTKEQKDAAKNLKDGCNNVVMSFGFFSEETFTGTKNDIKAKLQNIENNFDGQGISEAERAKAFGLDNIFALADIDGNGEITSDEFAAIAAADTEEMSEDSKKFSARDLRVIYDNVMASEGAEYIESENKNIYNLKDGSTIELIKDTNGNIISKHIKTKENGKQNIKGYYYQENKKTETMLDDKGRITYESVKAKDRTQNKTVTTIYDDENKTKSTKIDTVGRIITEEVDSTGNSIKRQKLKYVSDGKIYDTQQQSIGDCWVLASVNSLRETKQGAKYIQDAIQQNDDGSVTVKLKGLNKEYTYTPEQIGALNYNIDKPTQRYSIGDIDMNLIEMAMKDYRLELLSNIDDKEQYENLIKTNAHFAGMQGATKDTPLEGGHPEMVIEALTGKKISSATIKPMFEKQLKAKQKSSDNYAMVVDFKNVDSSIGDIITNHAYNISRVTKNTVYVVNPHDSSKEIAYPKNKFLENCLSIITLDLNE